MIISPQVYAPGQCTRYDAVFYEVLFDASLYPAGICESIVSSSSFFRVPGKLEYVFIQRD